MSRGRAEYTKKIFQIFDEEGPQLLDRLVLETWPLVPPAQAWRNNEASRVSHPQRLAYGSAPRVQERPSEDLIRMGARRVILGVVHSQQKAGTMLRRGDVVYLPEHTQEHADEAQKNAVKLAKLLAEQELAASQGVPSLALWQRIGFSTRLEAIAGDTSGEHAAELREIAAALSTGK